YLNARIILEQSPTSKLTQSVLAESHKTFANFLRDHDSATAIAAFDRLLAKSQTPELIKTRTLVALDKAKVVAESSYASQNAAASGTEIKGPNCDRSAARSRP